MIIKARSKQKYQRAGSVRDIIRDNGYKVTQMQTNAVWVDDNGELINVDRTPIRWDVVCGKKIDAPRENVL